MLTDAHLSGDRSDVTNVGVGGGPEGIVRRDSYLPMRSSTIVVLSNSLSLSWLRGDMTSDLLCEEYFMMIEASISRTRTTRFW